MKFFMTVLIIFSVSIVINANDMFVVAGTGKPGFKDGKPGEMNKPIRITPYDDTSVIIADINNHAIRLVSLGGTVTTIAGGPDKKGYLDGIAIKAKLNSPHGVAYNNKTGELYVGEASNHVIRKLIPKEPGSLEFSVSTFAGVGEKSGYKDGDADQALFNSPHGIILNENGDLFVADIGNARIRKVKDGKVITISGSGESGQMDGKPLEATYKYPMDMVMGLNNEILIADAGTNLIRKLNENDTVKTFQTKQALKTPHGIAYDKKGNIFIADMGTHRILKVDPNGKVSTLCGTGEEGSEVQQLNKPAAVLVHAGYLWIADLNNHQIKAIKID